MEIYVIVVKEPRFDDYLTRGVGYNYRHIRAFESKKRAENYAKKINYATVVKFVPSADK